MQITTHLADRLNTSQIKREKLRKLLLNYINFLIKCLNSAESKNEAKRILDSLRALENKAWIQNHSDKELSHNSYLREAREIYQEIDNLYFP